MFRGRSPNMTAVWVMLLLLDVSRNPMLHVSKARRRGAHLQLLGIVVREVVLVEHHIVRAQTTANPIHRLLPVIHQPDHTLSATGAFNQGSRLVRPTITR